MVPARFWIPVVLLALAWCQELADQLLFGGQWNLPMGPDLPIWGVLTAPFSHSGFPHLISNSVVFLPLSWMVLTRGFKDYAAVWVGVFVVELPVALFWPASSHGLSGVVYGLLGYLLLIGWLERRLLSILLGVVAFWLYGSALVALIPGVSPAGVSWIGHAGGFAGGLFAALAVYREPKDAEIKP